MCFILNFNRSFLPKVEKWTIWDTNTKMDLGLFIDNGRELRNFKFGSNEPGMANLE